MFCLLLVNKLRRGCLHNHSFMQIFCGFFARVILNIKNLVVGGTIQRNKMCKIAESEWDSEQCSFNGFLITKIHRWKPTHKWLNTKNYSKCYSENVVWRRSCACTCVANRQVRLPFYQRHKLQSSQKKPNFRITHPHVQCLSHSHRSLLSHLSSSSCTYLSSKTYVRTAFGWNGLLYALCTLIASCQWNVLSSLSLMQLNTHRMHLIFGPYFVMWKFSHHFCC